MSSIDLIQFFCNLNFPTKLSDEKIGEEGDEEKKEERKTACIQPQFMVIFALVTLRPYFRMQNITLNSMLVLVYGL